MENKSITKEVNLAIIKGANNIDIPFNEYDVKRAFISLRKNDVEIKGNNSTIKGISNLLEINNAQNTKISCLNFISYCEKDFAIRINNANNVIIEDCSFSCNTGCIIISDSKNITIKNCSFTGEKGNGICVLNASDVTIDTCNFSLTNGEAITIADNRDGFVTIHNNSFKRCREAIKSSGRNTLKITNNYFLTYLAALNFIPSVTGRVAEGIYKAEIKYNLFDDCCLGGAIATIVVLGDQTEYNHKEINISENIFSQKERAVIHATGVNYLLFKENSVRTSGESTVENSIINGIKA